MGEGTAEVAAGTIAEFSWAEDWTADLVAADVIASLSDHLVGLRGVCTSWDSGMLDVVASRMPGWEMRSNHAVSPVLGAELLRAWPRSSCGWDEWYFCAMPTVDEKLHAFCNWGGVSLASATELRELSAGFDLAAQLARHKPEVVVGDGRRVFVIAKRPEVVAQFQHLCERRRTTR